MSIPAGAVIVTDRPDDGAMDERRERELIGKATNGLGRLAPRLVRVSADERELPDAPPEPADSLELAVRILTDLGMLVERRAGSASALLGVGKLGRTPVVVTVSVLDGGSGYRIRAAWDDGRLVRNHGGRLALTLVAGRLGR